MGSRLTLNEPGRRNDRRRALSMWQVSFLFYHRTNGRHCSMHIQQVLIAMCGVVFAINIQLFPLGSIIGSQSALDHCDLPRSPRSTKRRSWTLRSSCIIRPVQRPRCIIHANVFRQDGFSCVVRPGAYNISTPAVTTFVITRAHSSVHPIQACSTRIITSLPTHTHTHTVVFDRIMSWQLARHGWLPTRNCVAWIQIDNHRQSLGKPASIALALALQIFH